MNRSNFPTRLSPDEIEAQRNQIKAYVILPVPPHAVPLQFETIGRTTFKKYVLKAYENLFEQDAFPISDYWNIPFVVSPDARVPHIVHTQSQVKIKVNPQIKAKKPTQLVAPKTNEFHKPRTLTQIKPNAQLTQPKPQKPTSTQAMNRPDDFSIDDGGHYAPPHRKYRAINMYKEWKVIRNNCFFFQMKSNDSKCRVRILRLSLQTKIQKNITIAPVLIQHLFKAVTFGT